MPLGRFVMLGQNSWARQVHRVSDFHSSVGESAEDCPAISELLQLCLKSG